jgi:endonuclease/exonuclease/phosphatase (EEP) superfamily protein YafD
MRVWVTIGVVLLAVAAVAFAARYVPTINHALVLIAALAPYLMLAAPLALVFFGLARHWLLAVLAAALSVAVVTVQLPWYVANGAPHGVGVRLVSANLRYGSDGADAVVRLAQEHADIFAVQELTPEKARLLSAKGLDQTFPHRVLQPREGPAGVGIWSRHPIETSAVDERFWAGLLIASVRIPNVGEPAIVVVTHVSAPWPGPIDYWRTDMNHLSTALPQIASEAGDGPVMVAGDFNATRDMREFRRLLSDGYHDAAEQAGAGLTRSYPANTWLPPLLAIDHILTRGCTATAVRTLPVTDSDHRALGAEVQLPHS